MTSQQRNFVLASIVVVIAIVSIGWFARNSVSSTSQQNPSAQVTKTETKSSSGHHGHGQTLKKVARQENLIYGPDRSSSDYPTPIFSASGQLWLAFVEGDAVYVTHSSDNGKSFATAVRVNHEPEAIDANGEGRPKIALGPKDQIYVTWTRRMAKAYTGEVRFSRSTDKGKTFSAPKALVNEPAGQRFDTLAVSPTGKVVIAWVDKRDLEKSKAANKPYSGAAIYYAISDNDGTSFKTSSKIKDNACECCRLDIDFDSSGNPVILWRDVMPGSIRDHAIAHFDTNGKFKTTRVSFDDWKLDGCPHHGPSLSIASSGTMHFAWFTGEGKNGPGVFYSFAKNDRVSEARRFGPAGFSGRPSILANVKKVFLVWREEETKGSAIHAAVSENDGRTWNSLPVIAKTDAASDHPILIAKGNDVFLSWFTKTEGYRLIAFR